MVHLFTDYTTPAWTWKSKLNLLLYHHQLRLSDATAAPTGYSCIWQHQRWTWYPCLCQWSSSASSPTTAPESANPETWRDQPPHPVYRSQSPSSSVGSLCLLRSMQRWWCDSQGGYLPWITCSLFRLRIGSISAGNRSRRAGRGPWIGNRGCWGCFWVDLDCCLGRQKTVVLVLRSSTAYFWNRQLLPHCLHRHHLDHQYQLPCQPRHTRHQWRI